MKRAFTPLLLLVAAITLAMVVRGDDIAAGGEAIDPCESPLHWHLGSVDPRFELSLEEVRHAVEQAGRIWEDAAGRPFFRHDPQGGMTIDLVYDHRQEAYERWRPRQSMVDELAAEAESRRRRVEALKATVERRREEYQRHGTPAAADRYQGSIDRYNQAIDLYNLAADRYNEALREAQSAQGPRETRAADLESTSRTINGRVISIERTLTIGLFGSYDELVLVLAHELGHALGIDHVPQEGAIMAESYLQGKVATPIRLRPADLAALTEQCRL